MHDVVVGFAFEAQRAGHVGFGPVRARVRRVSESRPADPTRHGLDRRRRRRAVVRLGRGEHAVPIEILDERGCFGERRRERVVAAGRAQLAERREQESVHGGRGDEARLAQHPAGLPIAAKRAGETDGAAGRVREILTDRPRLDAPTPRVAAQSDDVAPARPTVNGRKSLSRQGPRAGGRAKS